MAGTQALAVLSFIGAVSGFLVPGYEYVYEEAGMQHVGTMDVTPTAAGLAYKSKTTFQVGVDRVLVKVTDIHSSQYVGPYPTDNSAYLNTTFVGYGPKVSYTYAINYKDGQVVSVDIPAGVDMHTRNGIKASVANFQLSTKWTQQAYFENTEKLLHGDCMVHYVVAPGIITRSVMHQQDCMNRPYREVDNWGGWRCDGQYSEEAARWKGAYVKGRTDPNPRISKSDAYYLLDQQRDGQVVVKEIGIVAAVGEQYFEAAGSAQFVYSRRNFKLVDFKKSAGGSLALPGFQNHQDISYEFESKYGWNKDRNLKEREDLFSIGNTVYDDSAKIGEAVKSSLNKLVENFDIKDTSEDSINKLHNFGATTVLPLMYSMDYNGLDSVFRHLSGDASEGGKIKKNIYKEFLVATGTSSSAMLIRDLIKNGLTDGGADSARLLTGIAFNIRRPNTQLVKEIESLKNLDLDPKVASALPLALSHLVRRTCELGVKKPFYSAEHRECLAKFSDIYAEEYYKKLTNANDDAARYEAVFCLANLRWGKVSKLLQPYLASPGIDHIQAEAVHAAMYGTFLDGSTSATFLPIFMNQLLGTETRIMALQVFTYGQFDLTQLATVVNILYAERNVEVANYAYTLFDSLSSSINPCMAKKKDMVSYLFKLMKQVGVHSMDYSFGISKHYIQEYQSEKYGYGSTNTIKVVGSDKSYTPLKVSLEVSNVLYKGYMGQVGGIQLRIEGLAKAVQRNLLNKMPEGDWKLDDLAKILNGMGINLLSDPNIRVQATVVLKGAIVYSTLYERNSNEVQRGKVTDLLKMVMGSSNTDPIYGVSMQRATTYGLSLYEQPSEFGMLSYSIRTITTVGSLVGKVKKGISKGALSRTLDFKLNLQTHSLTAIGFLENHSSRLKFELFQDRVATLNLPRSIFVSGNLGRKIFTLRLKRPDTDDPVQVVMHSRAAVRIEPLKLNGETGTSRFCPQCADTHIISNGQGRNKVIADKNDKELGTLAKGEYFDCEYDLSDANVGGNAVFAFHPQDKNPATFMTSLIMGLRQARHFLVYFPRTEKCGAYMKWSKSPTDPVHEIEVIATVRMKDKGETYFYKGVEFLLKVEVNLKGEPRKDRNFEFNFRYTGSPGALQNGIKAQFQRKSSPALGLSKYLVCFSAENKYPSFTEDLNGGDLNKPLSLAGKIIMKYGEADKCKEAPGNLTMNFKHETTPEAKANLKSSENYKICMDQKRSAEWKSRRGLPFTKECYMTAYDASLARKYSWDVEFESISPEVRAYYEKATAVFKTAVLPFWNMDPQAFARSMDSPSLKLDVLFKDNDKSVDVILKTDKGVSETKDQPVNFPIFGGPLRNLRFDNIRSSLVSRHLIDYCLVTSAHITTLDNSTLPYAPENCWNLVSGHCSTRPTYAVFAKKSSHLPLALKVYAGGHLVELSPQAGSRISVAVDGRTVSVASGSSHKQKSGKSVLFTLSNWGGTYILNSDQNFSLVYDGSFVQVMPMMGVKGQHCGACGNFDGNNKNDLFDKTGAPIQANQLSSVWCQ